MINANARKWIEALRSGKYPQGYAYMQRDGAYCCLGVACEVFTQENPGELTVNCHDDESGGRITFYDDKAQELPRKVRDWVGLRNATGYTGSPQSWSIALSLVALNDEHRQSFLEIADYIESEPAGLFSVA